MPRPTKLTPARQDAIVRAVELGMGYDLAAAAAGIHRDTLHAWRTNNPAFSDTLKEAEARGVMARLERIQRAASEGVWQADAWWLERRYPEQWGRRDRVQVDHSGEVQVRMVVEARAAVLAALADFPAARLAVADALERLDAGSGEESEGGHADGR